jgi:hypothetical protein
MRRYLASGRCDRRARASGAAPCWRCLSRLAICARTVMVQQPQAIPPQRWSCPLQVRPSQTHGQELPPFPEKPPAGPAPPLEPLPLVAELAPSSPLVSSPPQAEAVARATAP